MARYKLRRERTAPMHVPSYASDLSTLENDSNVENGEKIPRRWRWKSRGPAMTTMPVNAMSENPKPTLFDENQKVTNA